MKEKKKFKQLLEKEILFLTVATCSNFLDATEGN